MAQTIPRGFAFPLKFGPRGHLNRASGRDKIKTNLHHIALTAVEDRPLNTPFGNLSYKQVFRNISDRTCLLVQDSIARAITKYEPRVSLRRVSCVEVIDDPKIDGSGIEVTLEYRIKDSGNYDDLTFVIGNPKA